MFRASLIRHLGFGAGVVGIAMLAAGMLVHRLVVGPVREIPAATDEIAQHGQWEPITPRGRRRDEIGDLEGHSAQMIRRRVEEVRDGRYGSAHRVAERVRRELDEPLRRVAMELTVLETLLAVDSEEARARAQIAAKATRPESMPRPITSERRGTTLPTRPGATAAEATIAEAVSESGTRYFAR